MNVKGSSDSLPSSEVIKRYVVSTLTDTFECYGYLPLDSSILCYYDLLASKYAGGSEILKEVYTLNDQGDRKLGLRYDLTVPFAKVISMNINKEISLPFKRYEVGKVFRDGPVKSGRVREFYQCDVDVCGIGGSYIEAEMLKMTVSCYKKLGIDVDILINNRKLLEGLIISCDIDSDVVNRVILSVDKLDKIGEDGVRRELWDIDSDKLDKLFGYFKMSFDEIMNLSISNDMFILGKDEISELFLYIDKLGLTECKFTPYLARGLEIYTGVIWEVFDRDKRLTCALGGGGRYDKIITNFIDDGNSYPAVGISFGIVPICEILKDSYDDSLCDVLIVPMNTNLGCLEFASLIRERGIRALIEMSGKRVGKVLEKADKSNIPYVIVIGENEINSGNIEIRDMVNSSNISVSISDIDNICGILKTRE